MANKIIMKLFILVLCAFLCGHSFAQKNKTISGHVSAANEAAANATVTLQPGNKIAITDDNGYYRFSNLENGKYTITVSLVGYTLKKEEVNMDNNSLVLNITIEISNTQLEEITIGVLKLETVSGKLNDVSGTAIYAGKKTELITLKNLNANLATNNTRQIYARIPGLNIWEYDRGGLQLGIGGRGLSPNRSSNFNIRQNGYDISADALGYPESYYTPSAEALEKIEIIRGAASLQYGPQFGGLVNFVMKQGSQKPFEFTSRNTAGSYGFFNTFNSIGGTIAKGKLNYYSFYQYKRGDDWRPNSTYNQHNGYVHLSYDVSKVFKITGEYTLMKYLAQQPGGLTDAQFNQDPSISVRARNWFEVNWNLINISLDYAVGKHAKFNWRNYMLAGGRDALGILNYINRPDNGGSRDFMSDKYNNFGSELRYIQHYKIKNQSNTFLIGTRFYRGLTERKQGDGNSGSSADFEFTGTEPNKSSFEFPGDNIAAFAENIFRINSHWSITPGLRYEHINTKANGYYYKDNLFIPDEKINENKKSPRSFFLLGIGSSWKMKNGMELYANISQNYRSVNFNDIRVVNTNARVDENLKDETGYNIDLGFRGKLLKWFYTDVSLFYLKYNNRIGSVFSTDTSFMLYRLRTNVSDSRNLGAEILLEGDILQALSNGKAKFKLAPYISLSLIDARYINTKNTAILDKKVENVPPVLLRSGISFGNPRFNISYQVAYQAKQYSDATNAEETPTAVDGAIPAFTVMDISASYNWRWFTVFTGVNNVVDKKYFTRRADGYPGPGIIPADRRNFYLTLQYKFAGK